MSGYVYIYGGDGIYKIGRAKDVQRRIKQFIQLPFPCRLIHVFPSASPAALERNLHSFFREKRANGEWFRLSSEDIAFIKAAEPSQFAPKPATKPNVVLKPGQVVRTCLPDDQVRKIDEVRRRLSELISSPINRSQAIRYMIREFQP